MPGNMDNDQKMRTHWRTELYKAMTQKSKYMDELKEPGLLTRWPKFLRLEVQLPKPTPTEVLANLRLMCPCEPATKEEIAAIMEEKGTLNTPEWLGQSEETDKALNL